MNNNVDFCSTYFLKYFLRLMRIRWSDWFQVLWSLNFHVIVLLVNVCGWRILFIIKYINYFTYWSKFWLSLHLIFHPKSFPSLLNNSIKNSFDSLSTNFRVYTLQRRKSYFIQYSGALYFWNDDRRIQTKWNIKSKWELQLQDMTEITITSRESNYWLLKSGFLNQTLIGFFFCFL